MASYKTLDIYKKTYDLNKVLLPLLNNINRSYRYNLGEQTRLLSVKLLHLIYKINNNIQDRLTIFPLFFETFEILKINLQLMYDLELIKGKKIYNVFKLLNDIGKQSNKWFKYTKNPYGNNKSENLGEFSNNN